MQMIQETYKYGIDIVQVHRDQELDEESRLCDLRCGALPIKKEKDEVDDYDIAIRARGHAMRGTKGKSISPPKNFRVDFFRAFSR